MKDLCINYFPLAHSRFFHLLLPISLWKKNDIYWSSWFKKEIKIPTKFVNSIRHLEFLFQPNRFAFQQTHLFTSISIMNIHVFPFIRDMFHALFILKAFLGVKGIIIKHVSRRNCLILRQPMSIYSDILQMYWDYNSQNSQAVRVQHIDEKF